MEDARVPVKVLKKGDRIRALPQGVEIKVLHPASLDGSPNGNSLVLWLGYGERSMAFLADIEEKEQELLFKESPELRTADCIKLPHHGGPLSGDFGRDVQASLFIISTGPNPWGLPRPEDIAKLAGAVYRTDQDGTIVVETDGEKLGVVFQWNQEGTDGLL